jgi:hypothetical protein
MPDRVCGGVRKLLASTRFEEMREGLRLSEEEIANVDPRKARSGAPNSLARRGEQG